MKKMFPVRLFKNNVSFTKCLLECLWIYFVNNWHEYNIIQIL